MQNHNTQETEQHHSKGLKQGGESESLIIKSPQKEKMIIFQEMAKEETLQIWLAKRGKLRKGFEQKEITQEDIRKWTNLLIFQKPFTKMELYLVTKQNPKGKPVLNEHKFFMQFFQKLKTLTLLQDLNLKFTGEMQRPWSMSNDVFTSMYQTLKSLSYLKTFSLKLLWYDFTAANSELPSLGQTLKSMLGLEKLTLIIGNCSFIKSQDLKSLGYSLGFLRSLKSIEFFFYKSIDIKNGSIVGLFQGLTRLISLESITLKLTSCLDLTTTEMTNLSQILESFTSLKSLTLSLIYCSKIGEEGFQSFATSLKSLKELRNLSLTFTGNSNLKDGVFLEIVESLKCLNKLQKLSLRNNYTSLLWDESLVRLSQILKEMKTLQDIFFDFRYESLSPDYLWNFTEAAKSLPLLHTLSLHFSERSSEDRRVRASDFSTFSQNLQSLQSVKSLTLELLYCVYLKDNSLLHLADNIKSMKSLREVSISLRSWKELTEEGVKQFYEKLKENLSLNISLNLQTCNNVRDTLIGEKNKEHDSI